MPGRIEGAVAVITGGAGGIGEGTARRFVAEGARCVVADIQDDAGARVAGEIGGLDVHYGVKHAARVMKRQGSGVILNTTSTAGVRPGLGPHVYTAAKHAVVGLTQSVAPELGRYGIRVNAIAPGGTVTGMTAYVTTGDAANLEEAQTKVGRTAPLGRPGAVADVANAVLYLASDDAAYVSGAVLVVDGAAEVIGDRAGRFTDMDASLVREAGRRLSPGGAISS